jgi:hypothetical protein
MEPTIVKRIWTTMKQSSRLAQTYQPRCYDGGITLFSAEESVPKNGTQSSGWAVNWRRG